MSLLLVLLPLRGWAGNVMAINMASANAAQVQLAGITSQVPMPADCVMQPQASSDDVAAGCTCDTCELCLAVANLAPSPWAASEPTRHVSPLAFNVSFSSAFSTSNLKPPIS